MIPLMRPDKRVILMLDMIFGHLLNDVIETVFLLKHALCSQLKDILIEFSIFELEDLVNELIEVNVIIIFYKLDLTFDRIHKFHLLFCFGQF